MDFHLNTPSQLVAKICADLKNLPAEVDISSAAALIVAISGGPDSTALLLALRLVSEQLGFNLRACHINHKLRGPESEADEQFCRELCKRLSVPLDVFEALDVEPHASESDLRATRYDFLFRCAQSANSNFVLLAHNSSDQVETLLFRIFRGTSPTGLTGMRSARQMRNGIWLLRPMLSCSRGEVDDFLKFCQVSARLDSSNLSDKFARNFLRNQVIPLCSSRFPSMGRQLERLRELVVIDEDFLSGSTLKFIDQLGGLETNTWATAKFLSAHGALQRRALAKSLEFRNIEVSFERVETILNMMASLDQAKRTTIDRCWDFDVDAEKISWIDKTADPKRADPKLGASASADSNFANSCEHNFAPVNIKIPGCTMLLAVGKVFSVEDWTGAAPEHFPSRTELTAIADLSEIEGPLVFRKINESDRITPLGMSQTVSLKRYLRSNKHEAVHWQGLVVADQSEVLWVPGVGLSEKIRVRVRPTHRLSISAISADFMPA